MKLVIAEKPSVANEIAKVIGAAKKEKGYFSGNGYYVSWCVGHLIRSAMPEEYNPELKKWTFEALPFVPEKWQTVIIDATKDQYSTLKSLIIRNDVTELICATDAGREGELIFRLVYEKTGCKKPFKRLWISSMEESAIKEGFNNLKDGKEYDNLYYAALCRMHADFLVGINATRLYSCLYSKTLNIGRVQSPTINLIVSRQREIENFIPQPYYVLTADCGEFKASNKVNDLDTANKIVAKCNGKKGSITQIKKEEKTENPEALYDLTSLQREANRLLGFSAQQTLDIAQSLYENKLLTYPRTDSRYLTEDMKNSAFETINSILTLKHFDTMTLNNYDTKQLNISRIINNKKVNDHHAIIPTKTLAAADLEKLPTAERQILTLVIYRLLTAPYAAYKYTQTNVMLDIEGESFKATGKQIVSMGYKEFQNNLIALLKAKQDKEDSTDEQDNNNLPPQLTEGQTFNNVPVTKETKKTKPPQPYTEETLLAAMEKAGCFIEDEELKDSVKYCGLGTPATRAGIIERIIKTGFIERKGKKLLATQTAYTLMDLLPEKLKHPDLTAEWELNLEKICTKELNASKFINDIIEYIKDIVESSQVGNTKDIFKVEKEVIGKCPRCGKNIYEGKLNYYCEAGKDCGFALWKEDKFFTTKKKTLSKKNAMELLKKGKIKMTGLYSPKTGKKYDANVLFEDTGQYINYKLEFINKKA